MGRLELEALAGGAGIGLLSSLGGEANSRVPWLVLKSTAISIQIAFLVRRVT